MTEKLQDMENEAMCKIVELEKQLMLRNKDLESIKVSACIHLPTLTATEGGVSHL